MISMSFNSNMREKDILFHKINFKQNSIFRSCTISTKSVNHKALLIAIKILKNIDDLKEKGKRFGEVERCSELSREG